LQIFILKSAIYVNKIYMEAIQIADKGKITITDTVRFLWIQFTLEQRNLNT
jgi:hypothetical protein